VIYLFIGENSFEIEREVERLIESFDGVVERRDGESLVVSDLQDLLQGQVLFSDRRFIVLSHVSENKPLWEALSTRLEAISDGIDLLLIEPMPDKRTKAYKDIAKFSVLRDFSIWTNRDAREAEEWVVSEAKKLNLELTATHVHHLLERVGFDQWRLHHAIEKLSLADEISLDTVNVLIEQSSDENVFQLLDMTLRGDIRGALASIASLRLSNDAYQIFGLLNSQILQLSALAMTDKSSALVAKDIGAHPFVLSKLSPHAVRMSKSEVKKIVDATAEIDMLMKSSGLDPWLHIERLLLRITAL
jgi:DNA polymerase III delta subunit